MMRFRRRSTALCLVALVVALLGFALPGSGPLERTALGAESPSSTRSVSDQRGSAAVVESTAPDVVSIRNAHRSKHPGWALDLGIGIALALAVVAASRVALARPRRRAPSRKTCVAYGVRGPPLRLLS